MADKIIWKLSYSDEINGIESEKVEANVPGCVQFDMAKAMNIPSIYCGDHEKEYLWMEKKFWHYYTEIDIKKTDLIPFIHFCGIEYESDIYINNSFVCHHEGMFSPINIDLSEYKGSKIKLEVIVFPAPIRDGTSYARGFGNEASSSYKPAFSYGWDWCPRFNTLGITDAVFIEYKEPYHFVENDISYSLSENLNSAVISIHCLVTENGIIKYSLSDNEGKEVLSGEFNSDDNAQIINVDDIKLWWPTGYGEQPIYTLKLSYYNDFVIKKIGFRKSRLVPNKDVWNKPDTTIKTCSRNPMTIEINNRPVFVKGSNFVPPELCRSQLSKERVQNLLDIILEGNMNTIRIWGGGYIYPDYFYDYCDEKGILVWQEFQLACADYSDSAKYLGVLEQEASFIIRKIRNHPCLMLWCGGNELFNSWSKMTCESKALRMLDKLTFDLDENTPFIMTSPIFGAAHGGYDMLDDNGRELLTDFYESDYTAYCEFGCGCPSEMQYLKTFMTDDEILFPITIGTWVNRHASGSADTTTRWFDTEAIKAISGCGDDIEDLIICGNEIQTEMYKDLFQEVRYHWPKASMAINWCFNEPWQTAAGNGLVNYPDIKRKSFYGVKDALRPQKLGLRFNAIRWRMGEIKKLELWVLNDSDEIISTGKAELFFYYDNKKCKICECEYGKTNPRTNQHVDDFEITVPITKSKRLKTVILSKDNPSLNSEYIFFVN